MEDEAPSPEMEAPAPESDMMAPPPPPPHFAPPPPPPMMEEGPAPEGDDWLGYRAADELPMLVPGDASFKVRADGLLQPVGGPVTPADGGDSLLEARAAIDAALAAGNA
jgi:hypothetical protein